MANGKAHIGPDRAKPLLLAALREGLSITHAVRSVGIARSTAYKWRDDDPAFAAEWDEAVEEGCDVLEDEARRRALGYDEVTMEGGVEVKRVTKYSDNLLMFTLKARRPEKFRDNSRVEHAGDGGGPIQIDLAGVKDELAARLARLANRGAEG